MPPKSLEKTADFPHLLTKWQEQEGLSNVAAAQRLRISDDLWIKWRGGRCAPSRNRWIEVARETGHTVEQIAVAIAQGLKP